MKEALSKAKDNKQLTIKDIEYVEGMDLITTDSGGLNLLDWSIAHHNYNNIDFLTSKYIDPNECAVNCFTRLYMGVVGGDCNKENITNITKLLIKRGCRCPHGLECSPPIKDYYSDSLILINKEISRIAEAAATQNKKSFSSKK